MATAYKTYPEESVVSESKVCRCEERSEKVAKHSYPELRNVISTKPPVPQPTCE